MRSPQRGWAQLLGTPGERSGRALPPLRCWTPPSMISSFGLKIGAVVSLFAFVPVTNMPDNASLQFYQKHLFGVILNVISYCQPHLQPKKIMTPAGSISFPMERTQVRREDASEQPKLGVPADPQRHSPLISRCAGTAL